MRPSALVAIALALVALVANAADLLLIEWFGPFIVLAYALGMFAGVGLIIALRRPDHPIGWLFLLAGACFSLNLASRAYAWRALVDAPGTLPGGELALLLCTVLAPTGNAALPVLAFIFPTGRPSSRPWAALLVVGITLLAARAVAQTFGSRPLRLPYALSAPRPDMPLTPNPLDIGGPAADGMAALVPLIDAAAGPLIVLSGVAFVVRFIRSRGIERLQMKWFAYATSLSLASWTVAAILHTGTLSGVFWVLSQVFLGLVPVAVGVAILRYRLYDIDVLINRTLVYGATTATLVATYALAALAAHTLLSPFTQGNELAVAASTLAVAALIQPVRRRVQRMVDRRFYRSRYDAARTVAALAVRLRDEVDLDALNAELLEVVDATMRPAGAWLWIRPPAARGAQE